MKRIVLTLLICFVATFAFSQSFPKKQTLIPLSNINGVPFYKDPELNDIGIDGFEIDTNGYFYFFGGNTVPCLAVFNGNKQLFRKTYRELISGSELHFYKNSFYGFAFDKGGKSVFININPANGSLSTVANPLVSTKFISDTFIDSCIVLQVPSRALDSSYYELYSISGRYLQRVKNQYNLNAGIMPEKDAELLGMWNGNYVFWNLDFSQGDSQIQKFWLINKAGKILAKKSFPNRGNIFGGIYAENPSEHRKVRNGNLYILGRSRTSNDALITKVPLQTFFYK